MKLRFFLIILAFAEASQAKAGEAPLVAKDANTVALWDFASGGPTYRDKGGSDLDLDVWQSPDSPEVPRPNRVEGDFGKALEFVAPLKLVLAKTTPPPQLDREVSVEAWIFAMDDKEGIGMGIIQYGGAGGNGFRFGLESTGQLLWLLAGADGSEVALRSEESVPLGKWIHVAATYDGKRMRVYVNGRKEGERDLEGANPKPESELIIGYFGGGSRPYFHGAIWAIRISDIARDTF